MNHLIIILKKNGLLTIILVIIEYKGVNEQNLKSTFKL